MGSDWEMPGRSQHARRCVHGHTHSCGVWFVCAIALCGSPGGVKKNKRMEKEKNAHWRVPFFRARSLTRSSPTLTSSRSSVVRGTRVRGRGSMQK